MIPHLITKTTIILQGQSLQHSAGGGLCPVSFHRNRGAPGFSTLSAMIAAPGGQQLTTLQGHSGPLFGASDAQAKRDGVDQTQQFMVNLCKMMGN